MVLEIFLPAAKGLCVGFSTSCLALPGLALPGLTNLCLLETLDICRNSIDVAVLGGGVGVSFLSGGALLGRGGGDSDLYRSRGSMEGTADTRSEFGSGWFL